MRMAATGAFSLHCRRRDEALHVTIPIPSLQLKQGGCRTDAGRATEEGANYCR